MSKEIKTCRQCILNQEDDINISFNGDGICQYCLYYEKLMDGLGSKVNREEWLERKISEIKKYGENKKFDCILGVSGGVDSSYMALWAKRNQLRPLLVHLDNGWDSELAIKNIEVICNKLDFELYTHVIDWDEFRGLQLSYLRASVVDIEVLTDHAISSVISKLAKKFRIKYVMSGFNYSTEAVMPKGWTFDKRDWDNIQDISRQYGGPKKIKTYPHLTFINKLLIHFVNRIEVVNILNYMDLSQRRVIQELKDELGWREYPIKHGESIFTKFYQQYILPKKFNIDKRKAHLSNLICSGQITREKALEELKVNLCDIGQQADDKEYFLKKIGLSESEFDEIMACPPRSHLLFKTEEKKWDLYFRIINLIKRKSA